VCSAELIYLILLFLFEWSKGDARADLRRELRARGLNPGGGLDALK
jgi:hypothetical protein